MYFVPIRRYEPLDLNPNAHLILSLKKELQVGNMWHLFLLKRWRVWMYEREIADLEVRSSRLEKTSKQGRGGIIVLNEHLKKYQAMLERIEEIKKELYIARGELAAAEGEMNHKNRKDE